MYRLLSGLALALSLVVSVTGLNCTDVKCNCVMIGGVPMCRAPFCPLMYVPTCGSDGKEYDRCHFRQINWNRTYKIAEMDMKYCKNKGSSTSEVDDQDHNEEHHEEAHDEHNHEEDLE